MVFDSETDYGELYGTQFILPSGKLNTGVTYRWEMASHGAAGWSYDRTDGGKKFSGEWYFTTELPNSPPKAVVTPDAWYGVKSGEKITLDASKSEDYDGEIVSFEWDFGDGQTAMGENIEHRFRGAMKGQKTYTVTLRVEDDDGNFGIDTAFIGVLPLEKTIEVTRSPMEFGKFAKMTAYYNWIGITDDTGEDVYIVSNIHLDGENYIVLISFPFGMNILYQLVPPAGQMAFIHSGLAWIRILIIPLAAIETKRTLLRRGTTKVWLLVPMISCDYGYSTLPEGVGVLHPLAKAFRLLLSLLTPQSL